jgi:2-desacetyl-2-hydroxyethyl bacteriochlorophyllide A dehydrogenase
MRAAVLEKPGVLNVREVPQPELTEYSARCELLYGAICTGTDTHILNGTFRFPVPCPTIIGHESIGRVVEVGAKVRHLRAGDLVTRVGCPARDGLHSTWGGFAEFGLAYDWRAMQADGLPVQRAHRVNEVLPADFDPAAATMMITWRETFSYTSRLGVRAGQRVLVIGSGGNGLAFVAHARNLGARPVVVGAPGRAADAETAGAEQYLDYASPHLAEELREIAPDGFDVAIDAVGKAGGLDRALRALRPGGTLGLYGLDDGDRNVITPGAARGSFTFYNGGYDEQEAHTAIVGFVQCGQLDAGLWLDLDEPTPLERIHDAFEKVRARHSLKAVVRL